MQAGAIKPGQTVVIVDDLVATGTQTKPLSVYTVLIIGYVLQEGLLRLQGTSSLNKEERHSSICASLNFCS